MKTQNRFTACRTSLVLLASLILPAAWADHHQAHTGSDHHAHPEKQAVQPAQKAELGEPAPDFTLEDANGNTHSLSAHKGKYVVLVWVNPGCPFVQRHNEENTIDRLRAKYDKDKVTILQIDSTHHVTPERTRKVAEQFDHQVPTLHDPTGRVGRSYEAKTTPHVYVIDTEGILRYRGALDDDPMGRQQPADRTHYVDQSLEALFDGQAPPAKSTKPYGCNVKYGHPDKT